jgi:uncharacterized lipoprotein YehR (DUF1307 family)
MKRLFGLMFLVVIITGCSGSKETSTVCKGETDEIIIEANDDEVNKIITKSEVNFEKDFGYSGDDDGAEGFIVPMLNYKKLSGVLYELEDIEDGNAIMVMTVDFTEIDEESMKELEAIGYTDENNEKYSLEKTIELFEINGYPCEE